MRGAEVRGDHSVAHAAEIEVGLHLSLLSERKMAGLAFARREFLQSVYQPFSQPEHVSELIALP
jgi:hypothetical protein